MVSITEAGTWVQTSSLPDGYNSHCLAYQGGFLYQTGGSSNTRGPADGTNVFFAKLTNGIAGAWNQRMRSPWLSAQANSPSDAESETNPATSAWINGRHE